MADLIQPGQAVEGNKIKGQSRNPPRGRGLFPHLLNGHRVYRFDVTFDVKASIDEPLSDSTQINPNASVDPEDKIICEDAMIASKKNKISRKVSRGSSTHKTNQWKFPNQSMVQVVKAHPEILNAIEKRE